MKKPFHNTAGTELTVSRTGAPATNDSVTRHHSVRAVGVAILIAGLITAGVVSRAPTVGAVQEERSDRGGLFVTVLTDASRDHLGMATVVNASGKTLFFDCRGIDAIPAANVATQSASALFVLNPAWLTEPDVLRLLDGAAGQDPPLHIWGPAGTKRWLGRRYPDGPGTSAGSQPTVVEFHEGGIADAGLHVTAISLADDTVAYRVQSDGYAIAIASNVKSSAKLAGVIEGVDLAILRHSNAPDVLKAFDRARPTQLWIVPDGLPVSVAQIREWYGGSFEMVSRGLRRAVVPPAGHPTLKP